MFNSILLYSSRQRGLYEFFPAQKVQLDTKLQFFRSNPASVKQKVVKHTLRNFETSRCFNHPLSIWSVSLLRPSSPAPNFLYSPPKENFRWSISVKKKKSHSRKQLDLFARSSSSVLDVSGRVSSVRRHRVSEEDPKTEGGAEGLERTPRCRGPGCSSHLEEAPLRCERGDAARAATTSSGERTKQQEEAAREEHRVLFSSPTFTVFNTPLMQIPKNLFFLRL